MSLKDLMPKDPPEKPDPALKLKVRNAIIDLAFGPPVAKADKWMDAIIVENSRNLAADFPFLTYMGVTYTLSTVELRPRDYPRVMPRLIKQLRPEMEKWLVQSNDLNVELEESNSVVTSILNTSNSIEDYRELIPSGLHKALDGFTEPPNVKRLSPGQLQEAKVRTQPYSDKLKARLLLNLLL